MQEPAERITVRRAGSADSAGIRRLALVNHMFDESEVGVLTDMLAAHLDGATPEQVWLVARDADGAVRGAAYVAPEPFADRLWNLYFLAVDPESHGSGVGTTLVAEVEAVLRAKGESIARVLVVETSDQDQYRQARAFYAARGFDEEARIRDFYGPGDAKVVFWKAL